MIVCLNCNASESEKPLLTIKFQGNEIYICPQCLPVLIHKPAKLADKLLGAENFGKPAEHHH
jgi:Zn-finger nucleic acid-binding protein